jgi:Tfp pilus assembly protein PilX
VFGAAVVVVAAIGVTAWSWWPAERVDCETLVGRSQAALDQADRDLKAAGTAGTAAKCNAYRTRVTVLTELANLPAVCGPPPKRLGAWPSPTDERKWYETLIFEECR